MANDFTVNNFAGSSPRLAPHLIDPNHAQEALDCNLRSGDIHSWREPKKIQNLAAGTMTVAQFECCYAEFDTCVSAAEGSVLCPELFITGYLAYPVTRTYDVSDCSFTEYRLGVPCPEGPPSVSAPTHNDTVDRDLEGRSYSFLYENHQGQRGTISPGSAPANVRDGDTVVVSGWPIPAPEWGVTHVILYRTVSGHETGLEKGNTPDTVWMEVARVPVTDISFTDNQFNEDLVAALEEEYSPPPPAALQGITQVASINSLAGYVRNRIYFSENNRYHSWPHYMDLDDNIRGITESNGNIYVATDGKPYVIEGDTGCENAGCRRVIRLPGIYPMLSSSNRGIAPIKAGAVYSSHNGLILLAGNSPPVVLTWPLYAPEDWQKLEPHTVIPVEHGGKLFVFAARGAFVMQTPAYGDQGWRNDDHSELSDRGVLDAFVNRQGELHIVKEEELLVWNRGASYRTHKWTSREWVAPVHINVGAGHVFFSGGAESIKVVVDKKEVLSRTIPSNRVFRLPMWANGARWQFTVEGTGTVSLVSLAPSMQDLGA